MALADEWTPVPSAVYPSRIIVAGLSPVVRGWGFTLASYSPDNTAARLNVVFLQSDKVAFCWIRI